MRINIDLPKEVFMLLSNEELKRKVEGQPGAKKKAIIEEALREYLQKGG